MRHGGTASGQQSLEGTFLRMLRTAINMASQSILLMAASASVVTTGVFVVYKDYVRCRRMVDRFKRGYLIEPLRDNRHQIMYHPRQRDETRLRDILRSEVSNQYYLVYGEVGCGKTRLVTEVVRNMMDTNGVLKFGAPIYVLASQGHSFADSFAEAVNYHFDEHLSLRFAFDLITRVGEMPKKDEETKLDRVLYAIENAAYQYLKNTGRPAVIVIDGVDWVTNAIPGALEKIQEKAKLWADTNVCKVIFVTNDEGTEEQLQTNDSAWARGALPLQIGDLPLEEAEKFLRMTDPILHKHVCRDHDPTDKEISEILNLVGGRMQHLLICKIEWAEGKTFAYTANHLKMKERTKFNDVAQIPSQQKVIQTLWNAPGRNMPISQLVQLTSRDDVQRLAWDNILRVEIDPTKGLIVKFQSKLTEVVVEELLETFIADAVTT